MGVTTTPAAETPSVVPAAAMPRVPANSGGRAKASLSTITFGIFGLTTLAGVTVAGAGLFPVIFVAVAMVAGFVAYYRAPTRYINFVFLLWWFTPWVRRMVDYHHGFKPANLVLVAPTLVTLISALTIFYRARELRGQMLAPFTLTLAGVGYGYFIGLLKVGFFPATYALLTWVGPICFSAHLVLQWRIFPAMRNSFLTFVVWGLPIIAAYGIVQEVVLPGWDKYWLEAAEVFSIGMPVPFGFRAFGTLNTPGPYSVALLLGMLYLLGTARRGMSISLSLALIATLLTRTRSAWVALLIGVFVVQFMGPIRRIARNWLMIGFMFLLAVPVLSLDVFRDTILSRIASFAELNQDGSVRNRLQLSSMATQVIGSRAEGEGLGFTGGATKLGGIQRQASIDNGLLEVFYVLGWPGGSLVMLGLLGQLLTLFRFRDSRHDAFANSSRAIFWAMMSVLLIGDIFSGAVGAMFWASYGFACAAHSYNFASGIGLRSRQLAREFTAASAAPGTA